MRSESTYSTARTAGEVLEAVARATWWKKYNGARCPPNRIPDEEALAAFLFEAHLSEVAGAGITSALQVQHDGITALLFDVVPDDKRNRFDIVTGVTIDRVHLDWLAQDRSTRGQHPLAKLIGLWQDWKDRQPLEKGQAKVSAVNRTFTRRPVTLSYVTRVGWQDDGDLPATIVDGEAVAVPFPDLGAWVAKQQKKRQRRKYQPGEQMPLKLSGVPAIPADLRLAALEGLPSVVAGDVRTLIEVAHAVNWPGVLLSEKDGAGLLARTRNGGYRRPLPGDVERFRVALAEVHGLIAWFRDRYGLNWRPLATVEPQPNGDLWRLSPPEWMRGGPSEQWTLSAAGSRVARGRVRLDADGSPAGRIVTGIEYRLAARWDGRPGVAPDLRPERSGGPSPAVFIPWYEVLHHAGIGWDRSNSQAEEAAQKQYRRAVARIKESGYMLTARRAGAEASAGDSIEIVDMVRGGNGRKAGLWVRASSRFVEAARLANLKDGRGFETVRLVDWLGLKAERVSRASGNCK